MTRPLAFSLIGGQAARELIWPEYDAVRCLELKPRCTPAGNARFNQESNWYEIVFILCHNGGRTSTQMKFPKFKSAVSLSNPSLVIFLPSS